MVPMGDLTIVHRKGKLWWLIVAIVVFLWLYRSSYAGNPPEKAWILHVLAFVFMGYLSVMYSWVDSVQIKLAERVALSSSRGLFWRKTSRYRLDRYSSVAIVARRGVSTSISFAVGLKSENQRIDWMLNCFPSKFAWDSAVRIANYLNLPVYDMMVGGGRTWGVTEVPPTLRERKMRINSR